MPSEMLWLGTSTFMMGAVHVISIFASTGELAEQIESCPQCKLPLVS